VTLKHQKSKPVYGHLTLRHFRLYKVHSYLLTVLNTGFLQSDQVQPLFLLSEDLLTCHNTDEAKITKCAANFLKFVPERIGGGGRGDNYTKNQNLFMDILHCDISDFTKFTHIC
jgi:hypothetical protein